MYMKGYTLKSFHLCFLSHHFSPSRKIIVTLVVSEVFMHIQTNINAYSFLYFSLVKQPFLFYSMQMCYPYANTSVLYTVFSAPCFILTHCYSLELAIVIRAVHKSLWNLRYLYFVLIVHYLVILESE